MTSFFKDDFWSRTVLQIAHQEPTVRHALVALSALHEGLPRNDFNRQWMHPGLHQYNLALQGLREIPQDHEFLHVHLLCCLLFVSIEVSQSQRCSLRANKCIGNARQPCDRNTGLQIWKKADASCIGGCFGWPAIQTIINAFLRIEVIVRTSGFSIGGGKILARAVITETRMNRLKMSR